MIKRYIPFFIIFNFTVFLFGTEQERLWGVWNIGAGSGKTYTRTLSTGVYERTFLSLSFDPNFYNSGKGAISYNGGYYIIDKVTSFEDGFHLLINWTGWVTGTNEENIEATIFGKIAVHFLTEDTIWLELVQGSNTDDQFPTGNFSGREAVLWRGKIIESGDADSGQK